MQGFDIRTLVLVSALVSLTVAITFGIATLNLRSRNRSTLWWSFGFFLRAIGFLGIFLRGGIPPIVSLPIANTFAFSGTVVLLIGVNAFSGRRLPKVQAVAWIGACLLLLLGLHFSQLGYTFSVTAISLLTLVIDLIIAITIMLHRDERLLLQRTIATFFFLLDAVSQLTRALLAILTPPQQDLFVSTATSILGFVEAFIMPICVEIALLTMAAKQIQGERELTIRELEVALGKVETLRGLLPICSSCKRIRDDNGEWRQVESYIQAHSRAAFSHGICPDCSRRLYPEILTPEPDDKE